MTPEALVGVLIEWAGSPVAVLRACARARDVAVAAMALMGSLAFVLRSNDEPLTEEDEKLLREHVEEIERLQRTARSVARAQEAESESSSGDEPAPRRASADKKKRR